jgi:hypothetical protein
MLLPCRPRPRWPSLSDGNASKDSDLSEAEHGCRHHASRAYRRWPILSNIGAADRAATTVTDMQQDIWSVQVPSELASELILEGFDTAGARSALDVALTASTIGVNLVTVMVAKDKVAELIKTVRAWMTRSTAAAEGSELVLDLSARNGDQQFEVRVVARRTSAGSPPQIETAALDALLASTLKDAASTASQLTE